jgi:polar amino acid transport system substrate-binding protein
VDFVNDRAAHLQPLLGDGLYAVGFPWVAEDCDGPLSQNAQRLCDDFAFSDPLIELVVDLYAGADLTPAPATEADLGGLRICQPELLGLAEGADGLLSVSQDPADCFRMLRAGEVDVARIPAVNAPGALVRSQAQGAVVKLGALTRTRTIHAVAARTNPQGLAMLERLNAGLGVLRGSGEWFRIVQSHLAAYLVVSRRAPASGG